MFDAIETPRADHLKVEAFAIDLSMDAYCDLTVGLQVPVWRKVAVKREVSLIESYMASIAA
ncbi:MAG: hypothetical protein AAF767_05225 [Pseudomonadota bacterium]